MKEGNFYSTVLIIITSFILLIGISIPFLQNEIEIKFAFDSITYLERATTFSSQEGVNFLFLLDMALNNSFGPVILGYLTSNNPYLIWFFNVVVYFSCSFYIIKTLNLKSYLFHTLIFINTISWISLVSLNKEIFCFISITALVYYLQKKNIYRLIILILCAYLVRWQLVFFFFVVVFLFSRFMLFKKNRKLHVFLLLIGISLTLPIYTKDLIGSIEFWREQKMNTLESGSGLYLIWINMDQNFLYFFSFIFKLFHLTVLNALSFIINPKIDYLNFHNFAETLQSFSFIYIYYRLWKKKKIFTLQNDYLYILILFFIFFVSVQIYTPRYLYSGYIIFSIFLCQKRYFSRNSMQNN